MNRDSIVEKTAKELTVGEELPVPQFELEKSNKIYEINLIDHIENDEDLYIANLDELKENIFKNNFKTEFYKTLKNIYANYNPNYVYAKKLSIKDYKKIRHLSSLDEKNIMLKTMKGNRFIPAVIPLTYELGKFVGYVLSEGYIPQKNYGIIFANSNKLMIDDFIDCAKKTFKNAKFSIRKKETHNTTSGCDVVVMSGSIFEKLFQGCLAYKHLCNDIRLPQWFFNANDDFLAGFLAGEIDGDGNVWEGYKMTFSTTSEVLFYQMKYIFDTHNIRSTISIIKNEGKNIKLNGFNSTRNHNTYVLSICGSYFDNLKDYLGNKSILMNKEFQIFRRKKRHDTKIISINCEHYEGYVYDFETEDHYFSANEIAVHNCCQIDLLKVLHGGFSTGHGHLREPNSIRSYAALAAIVLQANQNDMFGGQSLNGFDYAMAEGVKKSFYKALIKNLYNILKISLGSEIKNFSEPNFKEKFKQHFRFEDAQYSGEKNFSSKKVCTCKKIYEALDKMFVKYSDGLIEKIYDISAREVEEETHQAMEALVFNLNSLHSRAGSQTPFSSINFGMDTSPEGRLASKEFLMATWNGLGHGETPIFPISIFQIKNGVNYNPTDPNYDLFQLAMKVSAKRLFPNFLSLDASYNLPYYKKDNYNSYVTAMGCAAGEELVIYTYHGKTYVEGLEKLWNRLTEEVKKKGISEYKDTFHLSVWDANEKRFVDVHRAIKNPDQHNWMKVVLDNGRSLILTEDHPLYTSNRGRVFVKDLKPGDKVETYFNMPSASYEDGLLYAMPEHYYLLGFMLANPHSEINLNCENLTSKMAKKIRSNLEKIYKQNFSYNETVFDDEHEGFYFCNKISVSRNIPAEIFNAPRIARLAYLAGIADGGGGISQDGHLTLNTTKDKEFALQQLALIQGLDYPALLNEFNYGEDFLDTEYFVTSQFVGYEIAKYRCEPDKNYWTPQNIEKRLFYLDEVKNNTVKISEIKSVESLGFLNKDSYDLETATDKFTLSFVNSGNCRTRVMSNVNGAEESGSRGNFAFVTLNLPQIALTAKTDSQNDVEMMQNFWKIYDKYINLSKEYLEYRFEIIAKKKVKNFPFLMGQKVYMGSENLNSEDEIRPALKHASLSIGFCGLAECLKVLAGKHHGESNNSQALGLEIIGHLREMTDKFTEETHMNWTTFATPAESTAGQFLRATRKKFGVIDGVTDKEYFTNSSHVPVYYPISAIEKIKIEAPYHKICNAGQIGYVEMSGDPLKNFEAFEKIIRAFHDNDCGYFSINHPVDRDPICGYTGIIENECPHCHRKEKSEAKHLKIKI